MRVVAFLSEDAGVGKSLLACHLSVEATRATGRPAVLVEIGTAAALAAWQGRRPLDTPRVIRVEPTDLGATLERLHGEGVGLAVLDTPAPPSSLHAEVLSWVDLVVLPVAPRREALESVGRIVRFVEGQGAPFAFIVNRAGASHKFTAAYAMALAQHGTVCPIVVAKRPEFAEAFAAGLTVAEVGGEAGGGGAASAPDAGSEAAKLMSELWRFLDTMLTRLCGADAAPRPTERVEQRKFPRWPLGWNVVVARGDDCFTCRLVDLSGAGAGLEIDAGLALGDAITLALPSLGDLDAVVVRVGPGRVGVRLILDAQRQWRLAATLAVRMQAPADTASDAPAPLPSPTPTAGLSGVRASPPTAPAEPLGTLEPPAVASSFCPGRVPVADTGAQAVSGRIVVIGSERDGCGTSTLAVHLAVALIRDGFVVATVDLDPRQATFSRYFEARGAFAAAKATHLAMPSTHAAPREDESDFAFADLLADLAHRHDYVIVDTPGCNARLPRLALTRADVVVTPIADSFFDLDQLARLDAETSAFAEDDPSGGLLRSLRAQRTTPEGAPDWVVVRNRLTTVLARTKAAMAEAARPADEAGFRVGRGLTERVIYRELCPFGLTLLDLRDEGVGMPMTLSHVAARQELRALVHLVLPPDRHSDGRPPVGTRAARG